jgi:hypothetical protein
MLSFGLGLINVPGVGIIIFTGFLILSIGFPSFIKPLEEKMNDLGKKIWVFPDAFLPLEGEAYKTQIVAINLVMSLYVLLFKIKIANISIDFLYEDEDPIENYNYHWN